MSRDQHSSFPSNALESLEYPEVLKWIADYAHTAPGKRAILDCHPADGKALVEGRRARGSEAIRVLIEGAEPALARGGDLVASLAMASRRALNGRELLHVAEGLEVMVDLRRWSEGHPECTALAAMIYSAPPLDDLLAELRKVLDPRGEVRDEADPQLGPLRERIRRLVSERGQTVEQIAERWSNKGWLRQRKPILRGGHLLLAVRANHQGRASGVLHDRSQSGDTVFVEPAEVLVLSNRLVEQERREAQLVNRILTELSQQVLYAREELETCAQILGEVDGAFGAAAWARFLEGHYPDWPREGEDSAEVLELRGARHPLLLRGEKTDEVVPLTVSLGEEWDLLVVTGPNTGGKTVVLKTIGLLAALGRAGLPVTAELGTRIPHLQGLDADIGDAQSIESSLSTFSGHLQRILRILAHAGPGTLVLLDELGTGTDPEEGAALGRAVLEELLRRKTLAAATTHLGSLKLFSTAVGRAENASMEFDPATLAPKYKLLVGVPGASHALEVAQTLGLPEELLERARQLSRRRKGTEEWIADISNVRREAESLRERARRTEAETREFQARVEAEEEQAGFIRQLRELEAETSYEDLCRELEALLADRGEKLRHRLKGADREQVEQFLNEARQRLQGHALAHRRQAFLKGLKKGHVIYVPRFRERLRILKVDARKERVKLRREQLELELPFREITWVSPTPGTDPD